MELVLLVLLLVSYLVLLGPEKYDAIYNRIRYLISLKGSMTYFFVTVTQ